MTAKRRSEVRIDFLMPFKNYRNFQGIDTPAVS